MTTAATRPMLAGEMYPRLDRTPDRANGRAEAPPVGSDFPPDSPSGGAADAPATSRPPPAEFTAESVRLVEELPDHTTDADWHEWNRGRFDRHLRRPMRVLLDRLRADFIHPISPELACGRRQLGALSKSGYGRGRYHDAFGLAFADPGEPARNRAAQLYFKLDGGSRSVEFGYSTGPGGGASLRRLRQAAAESPDAVCAHLTAAPEGAIVAREAKDHARQWPPGEWAELLRGGAGLAFGGGLPVTEFAVRRRLPLAELPTRAAGLAEEVGRFLAWAWPFLEAGRTGRWPGAEDAAPADRTVHDLDEAAPRTLDELAELTSLPAGLLRDMEDALLCRNQVVLTGPPGTSKTFVARQFARYFTREAADRPQGVAHTLYMHTNWSYDDFFEGLRPVGRDGGLAFQNKPGQFLRWVGEELRGQHPAARHVLILDELNRCDTAAVLGELLQLLEYRGVTVPLLSGRPFVFPPNLYLIGTMNSADRSIGRMDLALRRRFFWLDLHPQPDALARWLARPGNNPAGFDAAALATCNTLLADHGIPPEQQVGHALFMGKAGGTAEEDAAGDPTADAPLTERRLRQVVRFGVLPYVRELLATHGGADDGLLAAVEAALLGRLAVTVSGPLSPVRGGEG